MVKPPAFVELSGDEEEDSGEEEVVVRKVEGGPNSAGQFQVPSSGTAFGTTSVPSLPTFGTFGKSSLERKMEEVLKLVESVVSRQAQIQHQLQELQANMRNMEQVLQDHPVHIKAAEESIIARINTLEFQEQEDVPSTDDPAS